MARARATWKTARRLGWDATTVRVVHDRAGHPHDVGRRTRTIPPALRRALRVRDGGCRAPGCTERRFVDAHHIHHWAHGGETSLANTLLMCRRHHRMLHEDRFRLEVTAPAGSLLPARRHAHPRRSPAVVPGRPPRPHRTT